MNMLGVKGFGDVLQNGIGRVIDSASSSGSWLCSQRRIASTE